MYFQPFSSSFVNKSYKLWKIFCHDNIYTHINVCWLYKCICMCSVKFHTLLILKGKEQGFPYQPTHTHTKFINYVIKTKKKTFRVVFHVNGIFWPQMFEENKLRLLLFGVCLMLQLILQVADTCSCLITERKVKRQFLWKVQ